MKRLEANGVFSESMVAGEWQRIRTMAEDKRSEAIQTYEEFTDWAGQNGHSLEPAFERRNRSYVGMDRVDDVVVFPVVSLAIYYGDDLEGVFPCSDNQRTYTVGDALRDFRGGDEDWLAQLIASVDRTDPLPESSVDATICPRTRRLLLRSLLSRPDQPADDTVAPRRRTPHRRTGVRQPKTDIASPTA